MAGCLFFFLFFFGGGVSAFFGGYSSIQQNTHFVSLYTMKTQHLYYTGSWLVVLLLYERAGERASGRNIWFQVIRYHSLKLESI
ncbi:hypothetical protein QBC43DRAFT_79257 [Cladorrhinum sp. PSN259]|nr:hypothetical protein QBC43DRAFT_79257 [Cladorrhinum sp. PSN259]